MSHPSYYRNLCAIKQDEDQLEQIPGPRMELLTHVTIKTSQAFGLIGFAAAPVACYRKGQTDWQSIRQKAMLYGRNGVKAGLIAGPLITLPFMVLMSSDGMYDLCYRIRLNKSQLTSDRFSFVGLAVGVGAAQFLGKALGEGALCGYVGGFVLGTIYHYVLRL